jgi:siroheme synthase (precorrin-2 oxidase/ferrochelatase)
MIPRQPKRITIFPEDIERLTGWSPRSARRLLQQIREHLGKKEGQILTLAEFCTYTGLQEEQVRPFMSD